MLKYEGTIGAEVEKNKKKHITKSAVELSKNITDKSTKKKKQPK